MKLSTIINIIGWELINTFFLRLKKNKVYKIKEGIHGINLGCGIDNPPNWIGLDGGIYLLLGKLPKFFIKRNYTNKPIAKRYSFDEYMRAIRSKNLIYFNLQYKIPFENGVVPAIYTSHFMEHIHYNDARKMLIESKRVLKEGGIIRIVVPSLDAAVSQISESLDEYKKGNYKAIQPYVTVSTTGYVDKFAHHRFMYNFSLLKELLEECGFRNIEEKTFQQGNIKDVEILDFREGLYVEAVK
jgi:predicted SAM-dependent methyltransferase